MQWWRFPASQDGKNIIRLVSLCKKVTRNLSLPAKCRTPVTHLWKCFLINTKINPHAEVKIRFWTPQRLFLWNKWQTFAESTPQKPNMGHNLRWFGDHHLYFVNAAGICSYCSYQMCLTNMFTFTTYHLAMFRNHKSGFWCASCQQRTMPWLALRVRWRRSMTVQLGQWFPYQTMMLYFVL